MTSKQEINHRDFMRIPPIIIMIRKRKERGPERRERDMSWRQEINLT